MKEFRKHYTKFTDYGCRVRALTTDQQQDFDWFVKTYGLQFEIVNPIIDDLITKFNVLGPKIGNSLLSKVFRRKTIVLNNKIEVLVEFTSIIPIRHAQDVLNWVTMNMTSEPLDLSDSAREISY